MMKRDELMRRLTRGELLPLYLFFGDEEFLVQEAVDLIINASVDPASRDFNFNTVYCKGATANDLINLCQTLPFLSPRRLVIAREIDALKAADLEELAAYLRSPSPTTVLVMIANQSKYEKKPVNAAVEAVGAVVRFFAPLDRDMPGWIQDWCRQRGLTIQRDAANYVWQTLGNDLQAVSNELAKTVLYLRDRKAITYDDVKAVVGDFREYTPFDLADAVGAKKREQAFLILSRLLQEGESPVGLLGSIAWKFRRLMQVRTMMDDGMGADEAMKRVRPTVIFHQMASFKEQLRSYSPAELEKAFDVLLHTDRALKSSGLSGKLVMERMILRLCGAG